MQRHHLDHCNHHHLANNNNHADDNNIANYEHNVRLTFCIFNVTLSNLWKHRH